MSGAEERELLEWAAKAAGYTGRVEFSGLTDECFFAFDADTAQRTGRATWNPRHDAGDSRMLQVACKIGMNFELIGGEWCAEAHSPADENGDMYFVSDRVGDDANKAACLAVLRCAAAIGKAMP